MVFTPPWFKRPIRSVARYNEHDFFLPEISILVWSRPTLPVYPYCVRLAMKCPARIPWKPTPAALFGRRLHIVARTYEPHAEFLNIMWELNEQAYALADHSLSRTK